MPQQRKEDAASLASAAGFLYTHLTWQKPEQLKTWVYHGHNIIRELEIFYHTGIDMKLPVIQTILNWLREYYHPEEGAFRTQDKPMPDFARHVTGIFKSFEREKGEKYWSEEAKVSQQVLRYQLYHLVEDDWLTYRLTGLAMKMYG